MKGHHIMKMTNSELSQRKGDALSLNRRELISSLLTSSTIALIVLPTLSNALEETTQSSSETPPASTPKTRFITSQLQNFLQPIPTFTIVDQTGTPYMVVGEDAKLSAYFFTSFNEAQRILESANKSTAKSLKEIANEENSKRRAKNEKSMTKAEVEDIIGINPWKDARVSTVPLDFAVGLANRGKIKGAYFRIAPAEDDVQDALTIDKTDDLPEGKVPLFYFEDFEVDLEKGEELWSGNPDTKKKIPLYFSKGQLIQEWKKRNSKAGKDDIPEVKVTELFSVLSQFVVALESDDDLEKLVLVAPPESEGKAKACVKKGGKETPFKLGERIVVL